MSQLFDFSKKPLLALGGSLAPASAVSSRESNSIYELRQVPVREVTVEPESRIIFHTEPRSAGADRFRFLRMRLRELWNAGKLKSLLITSPLASDGKSTIALNLATALSEAGKRTVLVIEGDLHHPSLTERLGLKPEPGLAECLERGVDPLSSLNRIEPLGWYLLEAGKPGGNPTELLQSDTLSKVIQKLSPHFDWILIDAPPVTPLTDSLSLVRQVSAALLVAREGRTPRKS